MAKKKTARRRLMDPDAPLGMLHPSVRKAMAARKKRRAARRKA